MTILINLLFIALSARAELAPDQRPFADVVFENTRIGRPRTVYQSTVIQSVVYVRTELGIFRIVHDRSTGRRVGQAVMPSTPGHIRSLHRYSDSKIICDLKPDGAFIIDVTVQDPLTTFKVRR